MNIIVDTGGLNGQDAFSLINELNNNKIYISTRRPQTESFLLRKGFDRVYLVNYRLKSDSLNSYIRGHTEEVTSSEESIYRKLIADPNTLYMYEREESAKQKKLTLQEKHYDIRLHFEYALSVLKKINPYVYFFSENPHKLTHRIFAFVANGIGIRVIFYQRGLLPWYIFPYEGISPSVEPIKNLLLTNCTKYTISDIEHYIASKRGDLESALPWYEKARRPLIPGIVGEFIKVAFPTNSIISLRGLLTRIKCYLVLHILSHKVDHSSKYAVFFLHYQPERTTVPDGGFFQNQLYAIRKLRSMLPLDTHLYVKEHPSTYFNRSYNFQRSPRFYRNISMLQGVSLVTLSENQYRMIDNSVLVASITGSPIFESIIRHKPSLVFGQGPYYSHELITCHKFSSENEFSKYFNESCKFNKTDYVLDIDTILKDSNNYGMSAEIKETVDYTNPKPGLYRKWFFITSTNLTKLLIKNKIAS